MVKHLFFEHSCNKDIDEKYFSKVVLLSLLYGDCIVEETYKNNKKYTTYYTLNSVTIVNNKSFPYLNMNVVFSNKTGTFPLKVRCDMMAYKVFDKCSIVDRSQMEH